MQQPGTVVLMGDAGHDAILEAESFAKTCLRDQADVLARTCKVAATARTLATRVGLTHRDTELLVRGAWLHNLGRAAQSLHPYLPLGSALLVRERDWRTEAALVAWCGVAPEEADLEGYSLHVYPRPVGIVADLLAVSDMAHYREGRPHLVLSGGANLGEVRSEDGSARTILYRAQDRIGAICLRVEEAQRRAGAH